MNQTSTSFKSPKKFTTLNSTQQSFGLAQRQQAPDSSNISQLTPLNPKAVPLKNIEEEELKWIRAVKIIHNEESNKTPDVNRVFVVTEEMLKERPKPLLQYDFGSSDLLTFKDKSQGPKHLDQISIKRALKELKEKRELESYIS